MICGLCLRTRGHGPWLPCVDRAVMTNEFVVDTIMRALSTCLSFCLLVTLCGLPKASAASTDPLDRILQEKPTADPNRIEYVSRLIDQNPGHPRILELRYFRTGQLMGSSQDPQHFRAVIQELGQLGRDAGPGSQLDFDCKMRTGEILFHCLHDKQAAYEHYKSLEHHAALSRNTLQSDYQRGDLYCRIAASALAFPVRRMDEVEKYTRLVMAYPYLGMEDRQMYQKFFELYEEAGRLFITAFDRDPQKLLSLEIYPSHPQLWEYRKTAIKQTINLEDTGENITDSESMEDALRNISKDSDAQKLPKPPASAADTGAEVHDRLHPATDKLPGRDKQLPDLAGTSATMVLVGGVLLVAAVVTLVLAIRYRSRSLDETP